MAKSSTRRVTIYINGKEVEASVKQIRAEMNRLVNEQYRMVIGLVSPQKMCDFQQIWTFFTSSRIELNFSSSHLQLFSYLCTPLIRNARFFHISPTKPIASAGKLVGNRALYLLRERKGLRNEPNLLWRTLLHQRSIHLAERGSTGCEISVAVALCVLREQSGEAGGSEWGRK